MDKLRIEQLWVPDSLDQPDAADFLEMVEVARQVRVWTWGNDDLAYTADEMLQMFRDPYERYVVLVGRLDDRIVARVGISMPLAEDTGLAELTMDVLPGYQHRGVGRELLAAAEDYARGEMRRHVFVETSHPASAEAALGRRLAAASGSGSLPMDSREAAFAQRAGYELEQVSQFSMLALPLPQELLRQLRSEAEETASGRYRMHGWADACPDRWVEDFAALQLHVGPEDQSIELAQTLAWDAGRVREAEAITTLQGRSTVVSAAEDVSTGHLVAFTVITVMGRDSSVVFQGDTVVVPQHRGNKLGLLIKAANMEQLQELHPQARRIYTWNAAENTYMLTVNKMLGYTPAGFTGQWQKPLVY
ncbi:GNAT family N-acetyltransferase [Paenarthrobacter sp. DKR-5]|uniref:GNAT family N-acetyltransferase n=1 Tax=Paenarthrobacter sp. DKR-5 TaxID=2835535 RepID=UPI0027DC39F1|nr:GNAT family N-acetyltransferase [Paenarthrobacter sp. DKR-5]